MVGLTNKPNVVLSYIILAYSVQGLAEHFCLPAQPLDNYFLKVHQWDAAQVAAYLAVLMIPWTIKPLFGVVTDLVVPASKRVYLTISFAVAACGYLAALAFPSQMLAGLLISGCGLSWGTALLFGLAVETFDSLVLKKALSVQAVAYYSTCAGAGVLGGLLCHEFSPVSTLQWAFLIAAISCMLAAVVSATLLREASEAPFKAASRRRPPSFAALKDAVCNRDFVLVAFFIWLWNFSPGFGTPLYFHYTNTLHFTQAEIGRFNGTNAAGMLMGAMLYPLISRWSAGREVYAAIALAVTSTLSYCLLGTAFSAFALEFFRGIASILGILAMYCLVAKVCRPGLETLITCLLIAIYNFASQMSGVLGGYLYSHAFHNRLWPLLLVSAAMTGGCAFLVRLLPRDTAENERSFSRAAPNTLDLANRAIQRE
jgi:Major Facilitator Superfamily.